jgi:ABC-type transporter Mla maintaining outer membrane lipid asymmetry ATPase subunit MlaF
MPSLETNEPALDALLPDAGPERPPPGPTILEFRGVTAGPPERRVLRRVSFEVGAREIAAVLVAGGRGRSTFARVAAGLAAPEEGAVFFEGRDVARLGTRAARELARRRGYASGGETGLFDGLDLAENVAFPLRYHRAARRREIIERTAVALAALDLSRHARALPREVPAGVRARAAIARALVAAPGLCVFDDPFQDLAPAEYDVVDAAIRRARAAGTAFVIATSHLACIYRMPDRIIALRDGDLVAHGPREQVLESRDARVRDIAFGRD